jgi:flagellar biosynthesis anti-sigma factor FlgM
MKIDPGSTPIVPVKPGTHHKHHAAKVNEPGADQVAISAEAAEALKIADPEARQKRIEELRNQVEAGTYKPSGKEIAQSLIDHTLKKP